MSYPRKVNLFVPWSKAMVAGATVDKPSYASSQKARKPHKRTRKKRTRHSRRKKKKVMNG